MTTADGVATIQRCYPQIYLACHTRHRRARSSAAHLSPRDSTLLAHLDEDRPVAPVELARHLDIGASTLSAAVKRLASLGYVTRRRDPKDSRRHQLRLTPAGARAMSDASVLDPRLVERVLTHLSPSERRQAIAGLELLARAARAAARSRR